MTFYASLMLKDGGGYVTVNADSYEQAREKMFSSKYGKEWAFMYDESQKHDCLDVFSQEERGEI